MEGVNKMEKIPKIIHYCWFGENEMPKVLKECMKSWEILIQAGYEIKRWDESNCSFNENIYIQRCYKEKKWAFVADYYRAKALYENGGIYLDTDVIVHNTFDEMLNNKSFIGFSCNCALSTAVIGSVKNSSFVKGILDMYDRGLFYTEESYKSGSTYPGYINGKWIPNNEYVTWYLICTHPNFSLNNKVQKFDDVSVYPKTFFELGSLTDKYYSRHINYNSWVDHNKKCGILKKIKHELEKYTVFWIIIRTLINKRGEKYTSFYKYREK